jgi:hypothetical protein
VPCPQFLVETVERRQPNAWSHGVQDIRLALAAALHKSCKENLSDSLLALRAMNQKGILQFFGKAKSQPENQRATAGADDGIGKRRKVNESKSIKQVRVYDIVSRSPDRFGILCALSTAALETRRFNMLVGILGLIASR